MNRVTQGHHYESVAATYLVSQGYRIIEQNYRCRYGELDIIAMDGPCLVFIEVKYRKSGGPQHPLEAVDMRKQQHISKAAAQYIYSHGCSQTQICRFDVVAVMDNEAVLYKDAFSYQGTKGW